MFNEHDTSNDQNNNENIVGNDNMNLVDKEVGEVDDDADVKSSGNYEQSSRRKPNWAIDYVFYLFSFKMPKVKSTPNILVESRSLDSNQTKIKNENCSPGFTESVHER